MTHADLIARLRLKGPQAHEQPNHHVRRMEIERIEAADALTALVNERYRLAYAICGGEDFPGLLDGTSVEAMEELSRQNNSRHMETIDSLTRVETELTDAQERIDALEGALREAADELDHYYRAEYPLDHPIHERNRKHLLNNNPARAALDATGKGKVDG